VTTPQFDELQTLRASGLAALYAYEQAGLHDASTLDRAITQLSRAFEAGDYTAQTVWSLTQALRYASDLQRIITVLHHYADHAPYDVPLRQDRKRGISKVHGLLSCRYW
jgi:hypothetical protein